VLDLLFSGILGRYPRLRFVSVESGVGWIQSWLEAADWQFVNSETRREHPEYDLLPSEYFKRQIYGCFWFECKGLESALDHPNDAVRNAARAALERIHASAAPAPRPPRVRLQRR